jgi:biopolymer transport protein ExbB
MPATLLQLLEQGGVALYPLGICSVLVIAVILERLWAFSRVGRLPQELIRRVENLLSTGKRDQAIRLLDDARNPYARIAKAGLLRHTNNPQELEDILTLALDAEIAVATRPLPVLGTIGNIAPFIGLFGTVLGVIKAFEAIGHNSAIPTAGIGTVMSGIAEALIATAAGLAVAIIAVVANNWCNAWVEEYRLGLERFATEWSYLLQEGPAANTAPAVEEPAQ